jgi:hypothetical protein
MIPPAYVRRVEEAGGPRRRTRVLLVILEGGQACLVRARAALATSSTTRWSAIWRSSTGIVPWSASTGCLQRSAHCSTIAATLRLIRAAEPRAEVAEVNVLAWRNKTAPRAGKCGPSRHVPPTRDAADEPWHALQ